jgi:hypothetical protein
LPRFHAGKKGGQREPKLPTAGRLIKKPAWIMIDAMKKLVFILAISFIVFSCDTSRETVVINNSDRLITFQWSRYDSNKITLNPQGSVTSEYLHTDLFDLQPEKRVLQERSQNTITVSNLPSWEVRVNNTLEYPISLTAEGWMDDMMDIQPGYADDDNHKGIIYTKDPVFEITASNNSPVEAKYQILEDILYVTIK